MSDVGDTFLENERNHSRTISSWDIIRLRNTVEEYNLVKASWEGLVVLILVV
jgi:hypothetical protein